MLDRFAGFVREQTAGRASEYESIRTSFAVRREMLRQLNAVCDEELQGNPRVDVQQVRARVDVDACINAFRRAAPLLWEALRPSRSAASGRASMGSLPVGLPIASEKWLEAKSPRIAGQVDVIARGVLIDYKTGAPKEEHWQQLRFYALLHWLVYRRSVRVLKLVYTATGETLEAEAPLVTDLEQEAKELASEIDSVDGVLTTREAPPARPAPGLCERCYVRHLCEEYWATQPTWDRKPALKNEDERITGWWDDVEVRFSPAMTVNAGYIGPGSTAAWGPAWLRVGAAKSPSGSIVERARLLGARVEHTPSGLEVTATRDTEVFWLPVEG